MSAGFVDGAVGVRVPATCANLGSGFDALGLALGLYDELSARVLDAGLRIDVTGEASADVPRDDTHLVVRSMRAAFDVLGVRPPGLALTCANRIPHSRGLGSSAAAIVAGVLLARGLAMSGAAMSDTDVLVLAGRLEGHPDNVAACLLGGLTIAWLAPDGAARAVRRAVDPAMVPVVLVPPFTASTHLARGLLPSSVPHADAAFAAGRAALLVAALNGTPQALFDGTEDRLHQQYRRPALSDTLGLVEALRSAGHAAVVSGAGPTVLVLSQDQAEAEAVAGQAPPGWTARIAPVDRLGALRTHVDALVP